MIIGTSPNQGSWAQPVSITPCSVNNPSLAMWGAASERDIASQRIIVIFGDGDEREIRGSPTGNGCYYGGGGHGIMKDGGSAAGFQYLRANCPVGEYCPPRDGLYTFLCNGAHSYVIGAIPKRDIVRGSCITRP
jgi:hypothetical protein